MSRGQAEVSVRMVGPAVGGALLWTDAAAQARRLTAFMKARFVWRAGAPMEQQGEVALAEADWALRRPRVDVLLAGAVRLNVQAGAAVARVVLERAGDVLFDRQVDLQNVPMAAVKGGMVTMEDLGLGPVRMATLPVGDDGLPVWMAAMVPTQQQRARAAQQVAALHGDEWLGLRGLDTARAALATRLPRVQLAARLYRAGREALEVPLRLDGLALDVEAHSCVVSWRGDVAVAADEGPAALQLAAGLFAEGEEVWLPELVPRTTSAGLDRHTAEGVNAADLNLPPMPFLRGDRSAQAGGQGAASQKRGAAGEPERLQPWEPQEPLEPLEPQDPPELQEPRGERFRHTLEGVNIADLDLPPLPFPTSQGGAAGALRLQERVAPHAEGGGQTWQGVNVAQLETPPLPFAEPSEPAAAAHDWGVEPERLESLTDTVDLDVPPAAAGGGAAKDQFRGTLEMDVQSLREEVEGLGVPFDEDRDAEPPPPLGVSLGSGSLGDTCEIDPAVVELATRAALPFEPGEADGERDVDIEDGPLGQTFELSGGLHDIYGAQDALPFEERSEEAPASEAGDDEAGIGAAFLDALNALK